MPWLDRVLATGVVPDALLRAGIRRLLEQRLRDEGRFDEALRTRRRQALEGALSAGPIAVATHTANDQHYEVPAAFYQAVLGRHLKYSSAYWPEGVESLDQAEEAMLTLSAQRAGLADGQRILELGCGWGSMTLFMAARYPASRIVAVSNSASQRRFIEGRAAARGLRNVEVVTANINDFDTERRFDRVVSIEMFEHVRNHGRLFEHLGRWLEPGGAGFVHVFCHRTLAYLFEARDASDWMARHFFTGGIMPSVDLLPGVCAPLTLDEQWLVEGRHYQRTSEAWLARMDRARDTLTPVLAQTYGSDQVKRFRAYWRIFFMACAELFGYRDGTEWLVAHYRFRRP